MTKTNEQDFSKSCWNKADSMEHMFILLSRDAAAPCTILMWVYYRLELSINKLEDQQIREAIDAADQMNQQRLARKGCESDSADQMFKEILEIIVEKRQAAVRRLFTPAPQE